MILTGQTEIRGRIVTMDDERRDAASLRIEGDRIVAVGRTNQDCESLLDFGDRIVLPGFIDGHAHIEVGAVAAAGVDCRAPTVSSIDEIIETLRARVDEADARGGWLVAQSQLFMDQKLRDKRLPTREDLDRASSDVAIVIRAGGHLSCLNSKAVELAGLDNFRPKSAVMGGPVVRRDSSGRPTGVIAELDGALPIPPLSTAHFEAALRQGVHELFVARGVTHVAEMTETLDGVRVLDRLSASGASMPRISLALWAPATMALADAVSWPEHLQLTAKSARVHVRGVKMFTDGGFSARTAAMCTPYADVAGGPIGVTGELAMPPQQIREWIARVQQAGLQPVVHTCGERATQVVAEVSNSAEPHTQVRVEHAGHLFVEREKTFAAMQKAGVRPMPNPAFLNTIGASLEHYVGKQVVGNRFLFRDMLDCGFEISGSSDLHVGSHPEQTNPFFMMWCSVARTGFDGRPIDPEQAVDIHEALAMHTVNAARALGLGDVAGSISPGKRADLVVVDRDPRTLSQDALNTINVDFVFVDGQCVHSRPGAAPAFIENTVR